MAYVPKQEQDYRVWPEARKAEAYQCAQEYRERGYKVRESRFRIGPRGATRWWSYRVTVYYNSQFQDAPQMAAWKSEAQGDAQ
jgi:hypothetical protein